VFLLLVFFLLTSTFSRNRSIELSSLQTGLPLDADTPAMEVLVSRDGRISVDGESHEPESLARLFSEAKQTLADFTVRLTADKEAPAGQLLLVMDTARAVGIETVEVVGKRARKGEPSP
jgi:biopolymer transport protein ExbD